MSDFWVNGSRTRSDGVQESRIAVNGSRTLTTDTGPGGSPLILLTGDTAPSVEAGTGLVSTWTSQEAASYIFSQGNSLKQPTQVNPGGLGRKCLQWDGTSDVLVSTREAADFRWLLDGTGFMYVGAWYFGTSTGANQILWSAQAQSNTTSPFVQLRYDGTAQRLVFNVYNGTTNVVFAVSSNNSVPRSNKYIISCGYKEGVAQEYFLRLNKVQLLGGLSSNAPATGVDPSGTLAFGCTFNGTTNFSAAQNDASIFYNSFDLGSTLTNAETWAGSRVSL